MSDQGDEQQAPVTPAKPVNTGGVYGLVDSAMFPVEMTELDVAMTVDFDVEAMMSKAQVHEMWTKIFNKYGVTRDVVKKRLIVGIMRYFIVNGSSPRAPYDGNIMVNGTSYAIRRVKDCLGRNVRRFCRAQADFARSILKADEEFAMSVGNRWGFFESYDLAFDFSDYCTGLTEGELELISKVKRRTLANTTAYKPAVDVTTPNTNTGGSVFLGDQGNGSQFHQ